MRYFLLVSLWVTLFSCKAQKNSVIKIASDNNTLLWKITGKNIKAESYLYGTFHLLCKDDIVFSKSVTPAIKESDQVYFEMDLDDPATLLGGIFFMNMKDSSLSQLLTPAEYAKLTSFFKDSLRMPLKSFEKMKPAMLEAFLYPKLLACKNTSGVEQELMKIAKANKKEILGFETIQQQSGVFDSIPYRVQAKSLYHTVDSLQEYKKEFAKLVQEYKQQHLSALMDNSENDLYSMSEYLPLLLDNRNENWVEQLKKILPQKTIFMAVGAGHLSGKKGLINLLREAGYTVQPVAKD